MATKAFVEVVVDKRLKVQEKHPKTINEAVKGRQMVDLNQLREEQWQEFDKEKKEFPR